MKRSLSIRTLLFSAHASVWLVPLALVLMLRIYDVYLLRQTEHQLIAESVLVRELYRDAFLEAHGAPGAAEAKPAASTVSASSPERYFPIEAQVDFDTEVLAPQPAPTRSRSERDDAESRAGRAIEPLLVRAQAFNLSAIRVLDQAGCVVATTRSEAGLCFSELPEVSRALRGEYAAVLRERISDEPPPPLGSIRRRGHVRVFTALPIVSDGRVIGVVRASRTGYDALSSLWANRRGLLWLLLSASALLLFVSVLSATALASPLVRLRAAAQRVARGARANELALTGRAPAEIADLQAVLLGMAEKLEDRARYVERFAAHVSHELKTPITAIRGAIELLRQEREHMPEPDRERFLGNIEEDACRMERLVAGLLELARAENLAQEPAPELDAVTVCRALLERHGPRVQLSGVAEHRIAMQQAQLESVLSNLVDNALRHGDGQPVRVILTVEQGRLVVSVHDCGPGVSEANRKRLFERFFTTERDRGGTGLGLALVKAIAEARGGSVSARFDAQGSTFSVRL